MNLEGVEVCKTMCKTCPFRDGSPYAYLKEQLTASALTEASRICHSTGGNNAIHKRTGKKSKICKGARDVQIMAMHKLGIIPEPTQEAWDATWEQVKQNKKVRQYGG